MMRDHGGDLGRAIATHGGMAEDWLDLSTGINPVAYPLPPLPLSVWARLPDREAEEAAADAAAWAFGVPAPSVLPTAGAQAIIQRVPQLLPAAEARIVTPTYNEHRAALLAQGWRVREVDEPEALAGAALAIVTNPNNPDGRAWPSERLLALTNRVALLVVDESFMDPTPAHSLAPAAAAHPRLLVIRSFGKFYGLAGLRLGFAVAGPPWRDALRGLIGPWSVAGPALAVGRVALRDAGWAAETRLRLAAGAKRLDRLATRAGWSLVGGTALFRTYATPSATVAQARLAAGRVWSRIFPWHEHWLRLGLPGTEASWAQLASALGEDPGPGAIP